MAYTLLNPSAVGFDVVRRPAATRVASVLLVAATATPALVGELAGRHPLAGLPSGARREALAESALLRQVRAASYPVLSTSDCGVDGRTSAPAGDAGLSSLELGGAHDLDANVAEELLGLTTTCPGGPDDDPDDDPGDVRRLSADLLAEAAVAAWTARAADPADDVYRTVRQAASATAGRPAGLGPHAARVVALLDGLPVGAGRWAAFRVGDRRTPGPVEWAEAMQEAAWAAWLSGRERPAAAAQMLAAIAVADRGIGGTDDVAGVWNQVSGMVAAAVVADVLTDEAATVLSGGSLPAGRR